jgi:hypothetical protein
MSGPEDVVPPSRPPNSSLCPAFQPCKASLDSIRMGASQSAATGRVWMRPPPTGVPSCSEHKAACILPAYAPNPDCDTRDVILIRLCGVLSRAGEAV